jgi:Flp pilus assembly protein TadD
MARRHHAQAAVVLARAAQLEPRRGSILEPLGRACFMSGQLERAAETFELLVDVDPSSAYAHYALGRTLVRLGRGEEGRTHLRLAAALAPDSRLYRGGLRRLGGGERP